MEALHLKIVTDIKNKIYNKNYREGEKIPSERELSYSYKVSRIVVREAISILRNEGLLEVYPGKGAYITKPNSIFVAESIETVMKNFNTTLEDVLEVREGLELSIIKSIINHANSDDIEKLYMLYSDMEKYKKNVSYFTKLDEQFHLSLAKYTKNSLYEMFLHSFIEMTQHILFEFTSLVPESINQAQIHHLELIKSIEKKEEEEAIIIMKSHMQVLREEIKLLKKRQII